MSGKKEARNHYKVYQKAGNIHSFFNEYLSSTYVPGTEVRGTKQNRQKPLSSWSLLAFQWGCGIKYGAHYMVLSAQKKDSEPQGVSGWGVAI